MKRTGLLIYPLALLLLVSCTNGETQNIRDTKEVSVEVMEVRKQPREDALNLLGTVEADREMRVSFKIGGKIRRLSFNEGDLVRRGTLLADLDTTELLAQREKAVENKNKAKRDLDRMDRLFRERIIPRASFQDAETLFRTAHAELKIVEDKLGNSVIRAPFTGRIIRKVSEEGEVVGSGNPVAILTDMDPILVKAAVPDNFIRNVRNGQEVCVKVDSYPGEIFRGTITRLETTADPLSRTFNMEIRVSNPLEKLRPGLIAQVRVPYGKKESVICIPLDAVVGFGNSPSVFVVVDSAARRRIIRTGKISGERVEVLEGLVPGEKVVIAGQEYLGHGKEVLIRNNPQKVAEAR